MRRFANERGLNVPLGREIWELWDEEGALRPIAFGLARWHTSFILDPDAPDTVVFREERPFRPWTEYEVDYDYAHDVHPQYSPWQLLPIQDALAGRSTDLPVDVLLSNRRRKQWVDQLEGWLENQLGAWRSLDERWAPTLKLLVAIQNRFWPGVSGRVVLPFDPVRGEEVDPMEEEVDRFEPLAVLDEHGLNETSLAAIYEWLVERGARIEGGQVPFNDGGTNGPGSGSSPIAVSVGAIGAPRGRRSTSTRRRK